MGADAEIVVLHTGTWYVLQPVATTGSSTRLNSYPSYSLKPAMLPQSVLACEYEYQHQTARFLLPTSTQCHSNCLLNIELSGYSCIAALVEAR